MFICCKYKNKIYWWSVYISAGGYNTNPNNSGYTDPGTAPEADRYDYTGGLSEEEQLQRALEASAQDTGQVVTVLLTITIVRTEFTLKLSKRT